MSDMPSSAAAAAPCPGPSPGSGSPQPIIYDVYEPVTGTWQYIVADPATSRAAIIDPVLDFEPVTRKLTTSSADSLLELIGRHQYTIDWILETHAHADHITAATYLKQRLAQIQGGSAPSIGIGYRIRQVQQLFAKRYQVPASEWDVVFDRLFDDDEHFFIGGLETQVLHLPGHTPDHLGYRIGDNVFCGDAIFHVDMGTARCDFPGGSAADLWKSGEKLLRLPGHVKIWSGHDYPSEERGRPEAAFTVDEHRMKNKHLRDGTRQHEFVAMRKDRDSSLRAPRLLDASLQMNIRAGRLPAPNSEGQRLLHLPLDLGTRELDVVNDGKL